MFRHLLKSRQLLAVLLPLALFSGWAACLVLCGETTAHHDSGFTHSALNGFESDCLDSAAEPETCQTAATAVVLQERQTVKAAALAAVSLPSRSFRVSTTEWTARLPEIKQNSPPAPFAERLFVRFGAFRI